MRTVAGVQGEMLTALTKTSSLADRLSSVTRSSSRASLEMIHMVESTGNEKSVEGREALEKSEVTGDATRRNLREALEESEVTGDA